MTAPKKKRIPAAVSAAASALGRVRSEKKAAAARENGKLGGRPRKDALAAGKVAP